jgi:kumamolisin
LNPARWPRRRTAGAIIAAGSAGSIIMMSLYVMGPANAGTPPREAVAQGITAAGLNATPVFPVAPGTKETVSFALKMRHLGSLESKVEAGIYRHFLTVSQFARRYGQPESLVKSLEHFLAYYGIKSTAYADRLDVTATGTAGEFDNALSVTQDEYKTKAVAAHDGQAARPAVTFHGTKDAPLLPATLAPYVESILGLTNYPLMSSNAVHTLGAEPRSGAKDVELGNRTPASFASDYRLTPLTKKGFEGQGQTIGIITFASLRKSDPTYFWKHVLHIATKKNRITLDNIDGGSGPVSLDLGSGETTLDVEQSGALARQANIRVYQAPNTDYGDIDAYAAAASQNVAGTVSISWGESETVLKAIAANGTESATLVQANDEFLLELAAQGQSNFSTSGDSGAYDTADSYVSDADGNVCCTNLSVDNIGDSPFTTTGGGTTLAGVVPLENLVNPSAPNTNVRIKTTRAWGWDWLWPYYSLFPTASGTAFTSEAPFAVTAIGGSGGGYSQLELRPSYQRAISNIGSFSAVPYLTPTDYETLPGTKIAEPFTWSVWDAVSNSPKPPAVITGHAFGRAEPDLSADADPYTGYEEYFTGFSGNPIEFGWGGTSFVAPEMNGSAAVIDSYLGHRVGFWNPAIYRFAASHNSPFTPVTGTGGSNTNLYYTSTKGHIYNPGTGLGSPNLAKLAADFRALT